MAVLGVVRERLPKHIGNLILRGRTANRIQKPFAVGDTIPSTAGDSVKSILVVTHCVPPQQGSLIAEHLGQSGIEVRVLGKAKSSWGRLLEIVSYSLLLVPRYDVLLVDLFGLRAFVYESVAILCARIWRKRIVAVLRNGFMRDFVERWPRWTRFILSQPNLVLVPHHFLKDQLSALGFRIDGMIPNFVKLENYRFKERSVLSPRFLYLRGMDPIYNAPMALQAFALIQQKYPAASLTMAGQEGEDSDYCRSLVQKLSLSNVHFSGLVPKAEIPALADEHDIYLHTNRVDNMPITVIEMWACGLPIVGTNVGGMPYLVRNGIDGILVESDDHNSMADASFKLLSDSHLAKTLSRNGRDRALSLTWDRVKPLWENALALETSKITANLSTPSFNVGLKSENVRVTSEGQWDR
jgi:glycosyltransferase involved in cell wall biosynthesis